MLFTDMNGDGIGDIIASSNDVLSVNDFSVDEVSTRKVVEEDDFFGFTHKALTTFDRNNDEFPEILVADAFDGIILYEQTTEDNFTKTELLPDVFSVEKLEVSDFNKDGNFDIVATSAFNGTCKIQINQGDDTFLEDNISPQNERIRFANIIDIDSHGYENLVYYDTGFGVDGITYTYKNENGIFAREQLSVDHSRVEIGTVGDIDNDGLDMVFGDNPFFETALVVFENGGSVSTEEDESFPFDTYPTIFSNGVFVKTQDEVKYTIIDQAGRIVKTEKKLHENFISLDDLNSGILIIQLSLKDISATRRLIKIDN